MIKSNKIIPLVIVIIFYNDVFSQCAMCKSALETNLQSGGTKGAGINEGILYLMAMPYIAMLLFGILYYFQKRSKQSI